MNPAGEPHHDQQANILQQKDQKCNDSSPPIRDICCPHAPLSPGPVTDYRADPAAAQTRARRPLRDDLSVLCCFERVRVRSVAACVPVRSMRACGPRMPLPRISVSPLPGSCRSTLPLPQSLLQLSNSLLVAAVHHPSRHYAPINHPVAGAGAADILISVCWPCVSPHSCASREDAAPRILRLSPPRAEGLPAPAAGTRV